MISRIRAQNIASNWYDGDGSGLYAIYCGRFDLLKKEDYTKALSEVEWIMQDNVLLAHEYAELRALRSFLRYKMAGN